MSLGVAVLTSPDAFLGLSSVGGAGAASGGTDGRSKHTHAHAGTQSAARRGSPASSPSQQPCSSSSCRRYCSAPMTTVLSPSEATSRSWSFEDPHSLSHSAATTSCSWSGRFLFTR